MQNLEHLLQQKFGLSSFRPGQLEIIESVIEQNDTLVFMPTGWGKSLTYQFSGVYLEWLVLVISPLISLMKDQVDKLNSLWLRAELINSTISSFEKNDIFQELSLNAPDEPWAIKFLYIAPERLNDREFIKRMERLDIALIAIDEAHCISQWGHDFRPSYLKIKDFIWALRAKRRFPILALTATATPKVRKDIVERLWISAQNTFTTWFDRKNLVYIVREITKEQEKLEKVLEIVHKTPAFGIVYCSSVKAVSKVYQYLLQNDVKVGIYTGEMNGDLRQKEQEMFMSWEYDVIVATNAFGMGIDKKDVRYVIHYNLPGSIENYYQEAGRAWRDEKTSYCIVIASYQDSIIQEFFIENTYPPKEDILKLYDYFYKDFDLWEGEGTQILKTYNSLAIEADLKSDMKVGSIIKIFEKYGIVKRWFDEGNGEVAFRGRGITLLLWKKPHSEIPILWSHQSLLKEESYFKLEQVKKLLFKPGCRKRFILEYFGDEGDLQNLSENCGVCDYCIDKKKYENAPAGDVIPHNVFFLILSLIKKHDDKFGAQVLAWVLQWSQEKKILEWNLDKQEWYGVLEIYTKEIITALLEELIHHEYLYKSFGQYPKIGLTLKGKNALLDTSILLNDNASLQASLYVKLQKLSHKVSSPSKKTSSGSVKISVEKIDTYTQTLLLYKEEKTLPEIAKTRELWLQTIETHIIKLYEFWKLSLAEIMKFSELEKLKYVKKIVQDHALDTTKLQPIKELCEKNITYFDIKIALALIEKQDL